MAYFHTVRPSWESNLRYVNKAHVLLFGCKDYNCIDAPGLVDYIISYTIEPHFEILVSQSRS